MFLFHWLVGFVFRGVLLQTEVNAVEIYIQRFVEDETVIKIISFNCNADMSMEFHYTPFRLPF